MFRTSPAAGPLPSLQTLDLLARQSGLIVRKSRKFSAHGFLLSLMQSVLRGTGSLNQLALALGEFESSTMSRQAMHQRFDDASSHYLLSVIGELLKTRSNSLIQTSGKLPFERLLIEDCTVLAMHKSNHESFPGNGNGKTQTAGAKIRLLADWLSGDVLECDLHTARSADQGLNIDVLTHCQKNDLIIRDMGFFNLKTLQAIEDREAFWISRLPASVTAYDTHDISLDERLKNEKRHRFEIIIHMGQHRQKKCRLVATRLSREQTEKNRRQRRRSSKRHGVTAQQRGLLRDEWRLIITNLKTGESSAKLLNELYALRWNIEIQFRALKQSCRIEKSLQNRTDRYHLEAMILSAMIYQIITLKTHAGMVRGKPPENCKTSISYEKLCDAFSIHLIRLSRQTMGNDFAPDPRHLMGDRRRRPTLAAKTVQSLT